MPSYDSDENDVEENIDIDSDQMTNLDAKVIFAKKWPELYLIS